MAFGGQHTWDRKAHCHWPRPVHGVRVWTRAHPRPTLGSPVPTPVFLSPPALDTGGEAPTLCGWGLAVW